MCFHLSLYVDFSVTAYLEFHLEVVINLILMTCDTHT